MKKPEALGIALIDLINLLSERVKELTPDNALLLQRVEFERLPSEIEDRLNRNHPIESYSYSIAIRENKGFVWLNGQTEYLAAHEYVRRLFIQEFGLNWQRAISETQFLEAVAMWCGFAFYDQNWKPRKFSLQEKRHAVAISTDLQKLIRQGMYRFDIRGTRDLEKSLSNFISAVTAPAKQEYSGPTARQQSLLTGMAMSLRLPGINRKHIVHLLVTLAPLLGLEPSSRTVQRYVTDAFSS